MSHPFFDLAAVRPVLFDGALGTELMARGLPRGGVPELWNIGRPEVVKEIHSAYFAAGADVVSTNSFGASPIRLAAHGIESRTREINFAAAVLARETAPAGGFVAGSVGPTGKFLKPQGPCIEAEFFEAFAEQARGLAAGGVDVFIVETQYDLREALAALRGIRSVSDLPVLVTMTFGSFPRGYFTIMGDSAAKAAAELEKGGAAAVGANCTLAGDQMADCVRALRTGTALPLVAQANAGQPVASPDGTIGYTQSLEDYVSHVPGIIEAGARFIGGCCGTTPSFIRAMARIIGKE